jgi:hypothetical protein
VGFASRSSVRSAFHVAASRDPPIVRPQSSPFQETLSRCARTVVPRFARLSRHPLPSLRRIAWAPEAAWLREAARLALSRRPLARVGETTGPFAPLQALQIPGVSGSAMRGIAGHVRAHDRRVRTSPAGVLGESRLSLSRRGVVRCPGRRVTLSPRPRRDPIRTGHATIRRRCLARAKRRNPTGGRDGCEPFLVQHHWRRL